MTVGETTRNPATPATSFHYLYKAERLRTYDRSENKERLNIWQLAADGMAWVHGECHIRMFDEKGLVCPLPGRPGFAVVEFGASGREDRLYFIDADDMVLLHEPLPDRLNGFVPYDVFLSRGLVEVLHFDRANRSYYDARVDYDPESLRIIDWAPTK